MRKIKKIMVFLLCVGAIVALTCCGTKGAEVSSNSTNEKANNNSEIVKEVGTLLNTISTIDDKAIVAKKEEKAKERENTSIQNKVSKNTKSSTASSRSSKPKGHYLTIKKGNKTKYFTESDLKKLGIVSYRYSFRNKESSNRQFGTFSGVKVTTLLDKAGYKGNSIRIVAEDGYTKEYYISDLKSNKFAFKKTTGTSKISVPAIITVGETDSFRLCFGQNQDDSDDCGDYNMQYWAKFIKTITIM